MSDHAFLTRFMLLTLVVGLFLLLPVKGHAASPARHPVAGCPTVEASVVVSQGRAI